MNNPVPVLESTAAPTVAAARDDSLGIDRAFVVQMARMPLFALLWVAAAFGCIRCGPRSGRPVSTRARWSSSVSA